MKSSSLAILSGLLIGTSYIPFPPWAIFFAFVPLWISWLQEISWRRIFWTGWITQFVLSAIGFNWVAHTMHEFGHMPWWAAMGVLFLFCSLANLYVPVVGLLWFFLTRRLRLKPAARLWLLPVLMSVAERVSPMIFDWHMGYTWLWARFPAFHLADIVGFIGLSNVGLFFNGLLLWAWCLARARHATWWRVAGLVPLLFLLLNGLGLWHGRHQSATDASLKFLVVQANIDNQEKLQAEQGWAYRAKVIQRFADATMQGLARDGAADFAVWPETAFPEIIDTPDLSGLYPQMLRQFVRASHTKLITGGYSRHETTGRLTNSFLIIGEDGRWVTPPYHKTLLLAFGEYFPAADWFPKLRTWFPEVADFSRGPGPSVLHVGTLKIGAQICYEGLFDWFSRSLANQGAQVLVNLTNDSWYGTWEEPYQHGFMTLARAVEVRRPLVRSTNTGFSTVALASGELLTMSPLHKEWFHLYEVPYTTHPSATLFMGWGFWFIPGLLAVGFILCLRSRRTDD